MPALHGLEQVRAEFLAASKVRPPQRMVVGTAVVEEGFSGSKLDCRILIRNDTCLDLFILGLVPDNCL